MSQHNTFFLIALIMMKLSIFCSTCSTAEDHIDTGRDHISEQQIISISSASSSLPSSSSTSSETFSIQTFPSLPTLHPLSLYSQITPSSASYTLLSSLNAPNSFQNVLAYSQNVSLLFSASATSMTIYSSQDALVPKFTLPKMPSLRSAGAVKSVAIADTPSSLRFFTAHQDGKIRAWKPNNSGKIRPISSLPTLADRLLRYPIPSSHVTVRRHRTRLWIEHADAVSDLAAVSDLLYSVSWDKTLKIWRLSDLRCLQSLTAHDDAVNAVAVGGDGYVYTGSADTRIRVWARSGHRHTLVATLEKHRSAVNALAVSGDGRVLYSGSCDRSILVWEREESANHMTVVGALRGHERAVMCLSTVGIGLVVSGSTDRTVRIWKRDGGVGGGYSCLCVMRGHVRGVTSVAAVKVAEEEEGYRVCSSSSDGEIRVWSVNVVADS